MLTSYICTLPDFYITNLGMLSAVNGYLWQYPQMVQNLPQHPVDGNGKLSKEMPLDISVIQGSILGPFCVLSMIFILSLLCSALFADNTTCLSKGKKTERPHWFCQK